MSVQVDTPRPLDEMVIEQIRVQMAIQRVNQAELARRLHEGSAWVSRRLGANRDTTIDLEDLDRIGRALGCRWLPRLDSNQQPADRPTLVPSNGSTIPRRVGLRLVRPGEPA